jgi:hypothetical protein
MRDLLVSKHDKLRENESIKWIWRDELASGDVVWGFNCSPTHAHDDFTSIRRKRKVGRTEAPLPLSVDDFRSSTSPRSFTFDSGAWIDVDREDLDSSSFIGDVSLDLSRRISRRTNVGNTGVSGRHTRVSAISPAVLPLIPACKVSILTYAGLYRFEMV